MEALSPDTPFQTQQFLDAFHYAQRGMGKRMQMGIFMFLHHDPKWYNSIKIAHTFADKYVDKALQFRSAWLRDQKKNGSQEDDKERYVLLQEIAKETDNPLELRSQILHVFLAGHDSTATTISNAIFHLCRHQDKWHKFRAEVLAIGDAPLTFELLKSMHYLQSVIKESKHSFLSLKLSSSINDMLRIKVLVLISRVILRPTVLRQQFLPHSSLTCPSAPPLPCRPYRQPLRLP